jgi:hypothetical protein
MKAPRAIRHAVQGDSSQGFSQRFSCIVPVVRRKARGQLTLCRRRPSQATARWKETE